MPLPGYYLQLAPALRPHFHQITGVVWATSWRRDIGNGTFHDSLFFIWAIGAENVSCPNPVSLALRLAIRGNCLGNLVRTGQPSAQFLGPVPVDNPDLIFTTVIVRHVLSPWPQDESGGMGLSRPQCRAKHTGQSMPQTLRSDAFVQDDSLPDRLAGWHGDNMGIKGFTPYPITILENAKNRCLFTSEHIAILSDTPHVWSARGNARFANHNYLDARRVRRGRVPAAKNSQRVIHLDPVILENTYARSNYLKRGCQSKKSFAPRTNGRLRGVTLIPA